jgi:sulfonate transport system substrate-binding protein
MSTHSMSQAEAAAPSPRRRRLLGYGGAAAAAAWISPFPAARAAEPVRIRYATGGGIGPNEMETVIFLEWMQKNVLQHYGRDYVIDMTFTRGTPEAATLLAAGQADLAMLSFSVFATTVVKEVVPGGLTILSDGYQDGQPGNAANTWFVLEGSPIRTVADLRGKRIAINAYGSAVDLGLRVRLKKENIDPKRDVQIVEVAFPNIGAAIREKRVDCGSLVLPFLNAELAKGGLRAVFNGGDAFGPYGVIFQVATNSFLQKHRGAVKAFLDDYIRGLNWFYDPANRARAIEITSAFTKSPAAVLEAYFMTPRDYYRDRGGCVGADLIQRPIDAMFREGLIDRPVRVAEHMDLSLLPAACPK